MKLWYNNLFDTSVITAVSSENSEYPAVNMQFLQISKKWMTGVTLANENVDVDLGAAVSLDSIIVAGHTLTSGDSGIQLVLSLSPSFTSPTTINLTYAANTMLTTFSQTTARYCRFKFAKSSSSESRQVGRIFLGLQYKTLRAPMFPNGIVINPADMSVPTLTLGGQEYISALFQRDQVDIDLKNVAVGEMGTIRGIGELVGIHTPLFFQIDTDTEFNKVYYARFLSPPTRQWSGAPNYFTTKLSFVEQI